MKSWWVQCGNMECEEYYKRVRNSNLNFTKWPLMCSKWSLIGEFVFDLEWCKRSKWNNGDLFSRYSYHILHKSFTPCPYLSLLYDFMKWTSFLFLSSSYFLLFMKFWERVGNTWNKRVYFPIWEKPIPR